jgi:hypothetical protein
MIFKMTTAERVRHNKPSFKKSVFQVGCLICLIIILL